MDLTYVPSQTVRSPRKAYGARTELSDDSLSVLPTLQHSNHEVYRPESSTNRLTQYAEERLQLIDRCERLLAATGKGLAGPFDSHDFEQSAGKFWQQDRFRSEYIQDLSELKEPLTGNMSDNPIFHNRAWTRPATGLEYWIEETCHELGEMSLTSAGISAHLLAAPSRDTTAWRSYVENEEIIWSPFRAPSIEQQFSHSLIYQHQETKQTRAHMIADHWSLDEAHARGDEEERADNIWTVSQGALFYQQQFPKEQPRRVSSSTTSRYGESDRQQSEKQQSDRGRPERQQCDTQRLDKRQNVKQQPSESQRYDRQLSESQKAHRSRSDTQPELKGPHAISEASVLDSWKQLLLALEELNSRMTMEEVKAVEQMKEGRKACQNRESDEFFIPGRMERIKQTLRLRPTEGPVKGKSRNVSAQPQCTVTGPYWEWNSVSPTVSFSNMKVTEIIQQAPDQVVLQKWTTKKSRNTLLEHAGRLWELHGRLSNEPDISRLIYKPLLEWMSRNRIGDTSRSRAQSNELKIVLSGRERARAQMLSASEHRERFAYC